MAEPRVGVRRLARPLSAAFLLSSVWGTAAAQTGGEDLEVFGVWAQSCEDVACQVFTTLNDPETGALVVAWTFITNPATGEVTALLRLPLGPALPPGVVARVDAGGVAQAAFQTCREDGCLAVLRLDDGFVRQMREGRGLSAEYVPYGAREQVGVLTPLEGFDAAMDAMASRLGE